MRAVSAITARAATRVLVRVLAKSAAYIAIAVGAFALLHCARGSLGPVAKWAALLTLGCWATLALSVFASKVHEEAQRIGGRA